MKKQLFMIAAMLLMFASSVMADPTRLILIKQTAGNTTIRPNGLNQGVYPLLDAEYDDSELSLSIENYYGDATISIIDSTTLQVVVSEEDEIYGSLFTDIDISSLPSSTYIVYIELEDGTVYYGFMQL